MSGRKEGKKKGNNSTPGPLSSKLCMLVRWFSTNALSKTAVVLHEKDEAVRCDLATM